MANTYSFTEVMGALVGPGGAINLGSGSGAAEEGITFEWAGDINTMMIGADGSGMHSLHADRSGIVTIRLLKTSPTNSLLSAMMEFQRSSAASHGQNTITIADKLRGDVITARQCAFQRTPGLNYGKDAGIVEWSFASVNITATLGGAADLI